MENHKKNTALHIITPFIVLLISFAVLAAVMIKPYDKIKMYLNLAFMDELKTTPESKESGLVIKDTEIVENYKGEVSDSGEFIRPSFGEMYAVLSCDALETDVPVYWGTSQQLFEHGACQASGSAIAGDEGNTVISAHVNTFFADLSDAANGDKVTIKTNYGEFVYTVKEIVVFNKNNNAYVSATKDNRLTLYTCKNDLLGNSDERIGVICSLTEKKFYTAKEADKNE